jgi:predicted alpha/beta hydrolase family esterase
MMKKVFIVHGFGSSPNGGWRSWLMAELAKQHTYACSLAMPSPDTPKRDEWVAEIARQIDNASGDEIYLVGHSLGVPAILRYLEGASGTRGVAGVVLVSGRVEKTTREKLAHFFEPDFDYGKIRSKAKDFAVIHGDNDEIVPFRNAEILSRALGAKLTVVPNGGHLNGSSGWNALPQCLEALQEMMK